ncbi:MAG: ELM1/GtrOC1 family putative glycosyltransferase, partial [Chromatocurvus sp.]
MPPRTWVMLGDKRGDNGQVETIVEALGWPVERKFLQPLSQWVYGKPRFKPTLSHLDPARSDPLEAPWPDLILTSGRRPSMAALWVRRQSGGRSRIVLVGKPSGYLRDFDLIVASSENQLPPFDSVVPTVLPFMQVNQAAVDAAAQAWASRLQSLPRPLVAILVGGETNPFVMDATVAHRLVAEAKRVIADGGTPWITTSRRTTADVVEVLRRDLPPQARL